MREAHAFASFLERDALGGVYEHEQADLVGDAFASLELGEQETGAIGVDEGRAVELLAHSCARRCSFSVDELLLLFDNYLKAEYARVDLVIGGRRHRSRFALGRRRQQAPANVHLATRALAEHKRELQPCLGYFVHTGRKRLEVVV